MRLSVLDGDPGYSIFALGCRVTIDGKDISNCYTADEDLGIALCYTVGDDGRFIIDDDKKCLKTICVFGDVKIYGYNESVMRHYGIGRIH